MYMLFWDHWDPKKKKKNRYTLKKKKIFFQFSISISIKELNESPNFQKNVFYIFNLIILTKSSSVTVRRIGCPFLSKTLVPMSEFSSTNPYPSSTAEL